jgi:hypothetical protein
MNSLSLTMAVAWPKRLQKSARGSRFHGPPGLSCPYTGIDRSKTSVDRNNIIVGTSCKIVTRMICSKSRFLRMSLYCCRRSERRKKTSGTVRNAKLMVSGGSAERVTCHAYRTPSFVYPQFGLLRHGNTKVLNLGEVIGSYSMLSYCHTALVLALPNTRN